ncbi:hypothetical protein GUITHDRAFT_118763 [Guillardia theta CCMP2712]|uniref:IPT/TIG domain-containing protein n=1 Tax=Guillardia theta (strain CCMP2712) TaxID=905079 RepID=L1IGQ6_GUITC|nr:hypothetical protein GUITHDRAFT_118763 [Guillardia theta CCMP2712]EKX35015.1 hypothetical protein GUITHDRAFT_118763 [Guillardia theta CCMP2712]|eukprot:XP_005821995.1 hypothetical protein GUITHDRAFT_118763 [Guillardia theta CCMP2712]
MASMASRVLSCSPSSGPKDGNTTVHILLTMESAGTFDSCRFGGLRVPVTRHRRDDISCTTPQVSVAGIVSADVCDGESCIFMSEFHFYETERLISVYPSSGPTTGGTIVTVIGSYFQDINIRLRLSDESTQRAIWLTSTTLLTTIPAAASAQHVDIKVGNNGVDFSSASATYTYERAPTVTSLSLLALDGSSGQVEQDHGRTVRVIGKHFVASPQLRCSLPGVARYITSSMVDCVSGGGRVGGNLTVEVSNNGQDWSSGGLGLLAWEDTPRFSEEVQLEPTMGPSRGGTQVTVRLLGAEGLQGVSLSLQVGLEGSAECRYQSGTEYRCQMPEVRSTTNRVLSRYTVPVHLVIEGQPALSRGGVVYTYYVEERVSGLSPCSGPAEGSTQVAVTGSGFLEVASLTCRFGASVGDGSPSSGGLGSWREVPGKWRSSTLVGCSAPAASGEQTMQVQLSNNGVDFSSASATYTYERAPTVTSLSLLALDGSSGQVEQDHGRTVRVIGKHFVASPQLRCSLPGVARYLTSSMVDCVSGGGRVGGNLTVEVSNNGQDWSRDGVSMVRGGSYWISVIPSSGPTSGGNFVSVVMAHGYESPVLTCRFGGVWVSGTRVTSTEISCLVPPSSASVAIALTLISDSLEEWGAATYEYVQYPRIDALVPSHGSTLYPFVISLVGASFVESNMLRCRFSTQDKHGLNTPISWAEAAFQSSTLLHCLSPVLNGNANMIVEVSNNAKDFVANQAAMELHKPPELSRVIPSTILSRLMYSITIYGNGLGMIRGRTCWVGKEGIHLSEVVSDSMVICRGQINKAGNFSIALSSNGDDYIPTGLRLISVDSHLLEVDFEPTVGSLSGGTRVLVRGRSARGGVAMTSVLFGQVQVGCSMLAPGLASCVSPVADESSVSITPCLGGVCIRGWTANSTFQYRALPVLISVNPSIGPQEGGKLVTITLENIDLSDRSFCKFGSSGMIPGTTVSSSEVACITPRSNSSIVHVQVTVNRQEYSSISPFDRYVYMSRAKIESMVPDVLMTSIQQDITLVGGPFLNQERMTCKFGKEKSFVAMQISTSVLMCLNVFLSSPGNASVKVLLDDIPSIDSNIELMCFQPPVIERVDPSILLTGGSMLVQFRDLRGDPRLSLKLEGATCDCVRKGDWELECNVPNVTEGVRALQLYDEMYPAAYYSQKFDVMVQGHRRIMEIHPSLVVTGASQGLSVTVIGDFFARGAVACAFTSTSTDGTYMTSSAVRCPLPVMTETTLEREYLYKVSVGNFLVHNDEGLKWMIAVVDTLAPKSLSKFNKSIITIVGKHFQEWKSLTSCCKFGSYQPSFLTVLSDSRMICSSPEDPQRGNLSISLSVDCKHFTKCPSTISLQVTSTPSVEIISPTRGYINHPVVVSFRLQAELGSSHQLYCCWGNETYSSIGRTSGRRFECPFPQAKQAGLGLLQISMSPYNCSSEPEYRVPFELMGPLHVESLIPSVGPVNGGGQITIVGSGFHQCDHLQPSCSFGSSHPGLCLIVTDTVMLCSTPSQEAGYSSLTLTTCGNTVSFANILFMFEEPPEIHRLNPTTLSALKTEVTLIGRGFRPSLRMICVIGESQPVLTSYLSPSREVCAVSTPVTGNLTLEIYSHQGFAPIFVWNMASMASRVLSCSPSSGPKDGNTTVHILLTMESAGTFDSCRFGGLRVPVTRHRRDDISCTTPQVSVAGIVSADVCDGESCIFMSEFHFYETERLISVYPSSGPTTGGTIVTVIGSYFQDINIRLRLSDERTQRAIWLTSTTLLTTIPAAASAQHVDIKVGNNGVDFSSASATYTYERAPTVTSLSLLALDGSSGQVEQDHGRTVRVIGKHFVASPQLRCSLPGVARYLTSSMVDCVSGGGRVGGNLTVEVSNNGQDWSSGGLGLLAWEDTPRFSEEVQLEPTMGPSRGGTQVTVRLLGAEGLQGVSLSLQVGLEGSAECRYQSGTEYRCQMPEVRSTTNRVLSRYTGQRKGQPKSPSQGPASSR